VERLREEKLKEIALKDIFVNNLENQVEVLLLI